MSLDCLAHLDKRRPRQLPRSSYHKTGSDRQSYGGSVTKLNNVFYLI